MSDPASPWQIILARQAEKGLHRLPPPLLRQIDQRLVSLASNPYPPDSRPVAGQPNLYRLPIADWRVTYAVYVERRTLLILEIAPRQQPEWYQVESGTEQTLPEKSSLSKDSAWYILYTYHGDYAPKVRDNLRRRVETMGLQDKIFQVLLVPESVLPGFLLVEMMMDDESWDVVKGTPGIVGWLGAEGRPTPIKPDELDKVSQIVQQTKILKILEDQLVKRNTSELEAQVTGPNPPKIRILVASDLADDRETLRKLLFFEPGLDVVAAIPYDEAAVAKVAELAPDVILIDTEKRYPDQFHLCRQINQQLPSAGLIVMSTFGDAHFLRQALLAGAQQVLVKPVSADELREAIGRITSAGESFAHPTSLPPWLGRGGGSLLKRIEKQRLDNETKVEAARRWFKFYKLGRHIEISLSVANLSEALDFYQKLGLRPVDSADTPYPWAVVSDGTLHLGLHQHEFSSPALTYFTADISGPFHFLQRLGITLKTIQTYKSSLDLGNQMTAIEFEAHEGRRVILANKLKQAGEKIPARKFLVNCHKFGELSLPTADINTAVAYWQQLGFEPVCAGSEPYPWATLSDGLLRLGLHQTSALTRPTLTYRAPDMPQRLEALRAAGLPFLREHKNAHGSTTGAVVESPDGQRFFLFGEDGKA